MAAPTAPTAPQAAQAAQTVHITVPGFAAFGEFHGYNTDCSADAELMARHPFDGASLDAATLDLWWHNDYLATGHGDTHGATLADIYWHLTQSAHKLDASKCRVARYIPYNSMSQANMRLAIIAGTVRKQTAIVFLTDAEKLAYNERGVFGHFVTLGGIDSNAGYLVGNGDDIAALGGHGIILTRWYGWDRLSAAGINGVILLQQVVPPPTPPAPSTPPAPTLADLQAEVTQLQSRLAQIAAIAAGK